MLKRAMGIVVLSAAVGALSVLSAAAADSKAPVKDGIEGKIVKVDAEKGSLTVSTADGDRTFAVTAETIIIGPRGGKVHKRLKDPRFHKDLSITVVADGKNAAELHLGYDRKLKGAASSAATPDSSTPPRVLRRSAFRGIRSKTDNANPSKTEDTDVDNEYPGKIKSVDAARHMLVITLLNGHDRSFMLGSDTKVTKAGHFLKKGLSDASLKPGVSLTVVTEAGSKKVKEVQVTLPSRRSARKAS